MVQTKAADKSAAENKTDHTPGFSAAGLIEAIAASIARHGWVNPQNPPGDDQLINMMLNIDLGIPAARIPLSSLEVIRERACALVLNPCRNS